MQVSISRVAASLACLLLVSSLANAQGSWKDGRATYYGLDGWSIHKGSCGFGYQWPDIYPGFDVAAIADASPEFGGSCGRCYEVKCRPADFTDGYGQKVPRSNGACKDTSKSLVVRTVDACPCNYPTNAYSNRRWCCGDSGSGSAHMDLSIWAFEKLADTKLGAVGISFRQVPCDYQPSNPAPKIANPSPAEKPWAGAKRPDQQIYVQRFDQIGSAQSAVSTVDDPSQADGKPLVPVEKIYQDGTYEASSSSGSGSDGNGCTDNTPTDGTSCQQQKDWGKCGENFLIAGNYCRATCGRCTYSPSSSSSPSPSPSGSSSSSDCWDKQPSSGGYCSDFKNWGKCGEAWIKDGGLCRKTCGYCS